MRILDPDRTEVVNNADWLGSDAGRRDPRLHPAAHRRPAARARRLRPPLRRRSSRSRCPSSSTRCCKASTRSRSTPTSSSAAPTRPSTTWWAASCSARAARHPQAVLTVPLLVGTDGVEKMGKSLGNYIAIDRAGRRAVRQADEHPGLRRRPCTPGCAPRCTRARWTRSSAEVGRRRRGRRTGPSGGWPARWSRSTTAPMPPRRPRSASTRCSGAARCPTDAPEHAAADRRPGAPAGAAGRCRAGGEHQRGPPRHRRRGGPDRTARGAGATATTCPRDRACSAGCCPSASAGRASRLTALDRRTRSRPAEPR